MRPWKFRYEEIAGFAMIDSKDWEKIVRVLENLGITVERKKLQKRRKPSDAARLREAFVAWALSSEGNFNGIGWNSDALMARRKRAEAEALRRYPDQQGEGPEK